MNLEPDRVPRGLELDRVENPVRVFRLRCKPVLGRERVIGVALQVDRCAGLQLRGGLRVACTVHDGVYVHVTRNVRDKLGALAGQ